uniref:At1g61320/AtMIF1 LRR domain-containing protein n=1 Tax=Setaria italica TaxID=4555 RepID=K4A3L0_SETIT
MKKLDMHQSDVVCYACAELPSIMPNLETLLIGSGIEVVNAPMVLTKFLYLKHLTILISERTFSPPYNYVSLVYFFDASPSLETFFLDVPHEDVKHESVFWRFLTFGGAA